LHHDDQVLREFNGFTIDSVPDSVPICGWVFAAGFRCDHNKGMTDVTLVLSQIESGDPSAAEQLLPMVYDELRKLAAAKLAQERPGQTLQATALVHDAYLRLVGAVGAQNWDSRGHFFAAAAEAMRRILLNRARDRNRLKRGGAWRRIDLDQIEVALDTPGEELLAVDEAIESLAAEDADCAQLVRLRFFTGLSLREAAECLGIPRRTADRQWAYARAWLCARLSES
jgi:RNA polymerase sigma factor (TIGR02999 family)